jgi:sugar phosphate isomerase/epimerase
MLPPVPTTSAIPLVTRAWRADQLVSRQQEVRNIKDAVCPGSGYGDFPAIVAAPREIGFDGYLMIEGFGYLAAERNSRGAFWGGI